MFSRTCAGGVLIVGILAFSLPSFAKEKVCRVYEFAELNIMADSELTAIKTDYYFIRDKIAKGMTNPATEPITAAEIREDMDDQKNCSEEGRRIERVLSSREKKSSDKAGSR